MSIKSTQRITRARAIEMITTEIQYIGNDVLGDMLDLIADSQQSRLTSIFDNFIVSDFPDQS